MLSSALALIRPKHWIKNTVVFAPLVFAREMFEPLQAWTAFRAFAAFCLTASAVYILNDIADAGADRRHPEKRHRPIASGAISMPQALVFLILLLLIDALLCLTMTTTFVVLLSLYFVLNLAYSWKIKDVMLLDVGVIAGGFMLRVLGGAYAIGVQVSSWIVLCSMFISLFLGFAKRRGELVHFAMSTEAAPRPVLRRYSLAFLDQMLTIAAAATVIAYALYTVAPRTIEMFGTDRLIYTTVFVIYGVFRYLFLIHSGEKSENPTNALTSDVPILVNGCLWIAACVYLIYFRGRLVGF
jgi:4-hydroxybenzoate polyprenyltransferase